MRLCEAADVDPLIDALPMPKEIEVQLRLGRQLLSVMFDVRTAARGHTYPLARLPSSRIGKGGWVGRGGQTSRLGWGAAERSSLDQACMEITRPISDWKQAHKTVTRQTSSPR